MPKDPNLELLATVHAMQAASLDTQKGLDAAIANSVDGHIVMSVEAAAAIKTILSIQNRIIKGLIESDQLVKEHAEALLERLENL